MQCCGLHFGADVAESIEGASVGAIIVGTVQAQSV
jgi:hypothetical protein